MKLASLYVATVHLYFNCSSRGPVQCDGGVWNRVGKRARGYVGTISHQLFETATSSNTIGLNCEVHPPARAVDLISETLCHSAMLPASTSSGQRLPIS